MQTTFKDLHRPKTFAVDRLPWIIAGAALLFYLATLNHWVTMGSVGFVGEVGGWLWPRYQLSAINYLATLPFRLLPASTLPLALNCYTVVLAAFVLGQLARCVALFPHDRTQQQRDRETNEHSFLTFRWAWVPPVFAAMVWAFHSTFWEHAVAATGEMIELAVFAYVVRSLMEFRIDGDESWALRAALGYGALMSSTGNWAITGMLPLFLGAMIWMRGVSFFNLRFLSRLLGLGLLGYSLVLLMPWIQGRQPDAIDGFGGLLKAALSYQKNFLANFPLKQAWVLGITSLLPLGVISIRWPSSFGDNSPMGAQLASLVFHLAHGFLLLLGLWVLFDPEFSPRQLGGGFTWLPLYFLAVLCLGYFCGYFLLIFGKAARPRGHSSTPSNPLNPVVIGALCVVITAAPALLLYKNFSPIRAMNGPTLRNFGKLMVKQLPNQPALVLTDDATTYSIAVAAFHLDQQMPRHALLNSHLMLASPYHRYLKQVYGANFSTELDKQTNLLIADVGELVKILNAASQKMPVYYLHYSFGYYFERLQPMPEGFIYRLQPYPEGQLVAPPMDDTTIARTEQFWNELEQQVIPEMTRNTALLRAPKSNNPLVRHLNLAPIPDGQKFSISAIYARALDWWGVQLQRAGKLPQARHRFEQSLALNPGNLSAKVNLLFNQGLMTNNLTPVALSRELEDQLRGYNAWDRFLAENGPVDEPQFVNQQAIIFAQGGLYRQAAELLTRLTQLSPDNLTAYLMLAKVQNLANFPDDALKSLRVARKLPGAGAAQSEILAGETTAYYAKQQPAKAATLIEAALMLQGKDLTFLNSALQIYLSHQQHTNALGVVNRILQITPDDPDALVNQSYIELQLGQFQAAVQALNRVLELQPANHVARLNRAIACLQTGDLGTAQSDYEFLYNLYHDSYQISFGLAQIAVRKKDNEAALKYFSTYLQFAPQGTAEYKSVLEQVSALRAGKP